MKTPKLLTALIYWIFSITAGSAYAETPTLTVFTYSSFTSEWGPGPLIKKAYETRCQCNLKFVGLEDGAALLSRLKLEGNRTSADVILGLDTSLIAEAQATELLAPHDVNIADINLAVTWSNSYFLPYDFGYFGFVYDGEKIQTPPKTLRDLMLNPDSPPVIIQDPRTSTPGLGLILWARKVFGEDDIDAWEKFASKIVTVTKGWSEAYGLFLKGEAPMVLSYTTSPAYHRHIENSERYRVAMFDDGHYQQVEVIARLASSRNPTLAQNFLEFMLSNDVQKILPTTNWMLPAVKTGQALPEAFKESEIPKVVLGFTPEEVSANRKNWIKRWLGAVAK